MAGDRLGVAIASFARLAALPTIIARVRRRASTWPPTPRRSAKCLRQDRLLASLVAARPGLRVPGAWDGFELAVRAILGQQISVAAATALAGRLVREFGDSLPENLAGAVPGLTHVFPCAERLAAADLSSLPMPRARIAALSSLASAVAADPAIFGPRRRLGEAIAKLKSLPGIGEWTAQYIAMRELREPDAFPAADVGLMRALAGPGGRRPTPAELLARAEPWRPWRAYAALHLWAAPAHPSSLQGESLHDRQAA